MAPFPTFYNPALYARLRTAGSIMLGCVATIVMVFSAMNFLLPNA